MDIEQLHRLGHAMSDSNLSLSAMGQDSLLHVFYPKSASRLLRNDVVIVDRLAFFDFHSLVLLCSPWDFDFPLGR